MTACPDAAVAANKLPPKLFSPPGFANVASCICPTCCGACCPGILAVTVPSLPMDMLCAFVGKVMPGSRASPSAVTMLPWASMWNDPARV